jgi:hypothetical protein
LLNNELKAQKKIKKELDELKRGEITIAKKETVLESDEKKLVKGVEKLEKQENWSREFQFYCSHKLIEDANVVLCGMFHTKKACNYENCPLKNDL